MAVLHTSMHECKWECAREVWCGVTAESMSASEPDTVITMGDMECVSEQKCHRNGCSREPGAGPA